MLLRKGAEVNAARAGGWTALHEAAWWGHKNVAAVLLEAGAHASAPDKYDRTPLDLALRKGHSDVAELLRKHRAK